MHQLSTGAFEAAIEATLVVFYGFLGLSKCPTYRLSRSLKIGPVCPVHPVWPVYLHVPLLGTSAKRILG